MKFMEHPEINDHSPKTWAILGPTRTGTSFLAQVLGENGVDIENCGNGHNEDIDFVKFNDMILKEAGGDWRNLPPDEAIAKAVQNHEEEIIALIKRKQKKVWGFKDPRTIFTIRHWLKHLGDDDVYLVAVFRHPDHAAASMNKIWPHRSVEKSREYVVEAYRRTLEAIEEFIK